MQFDEMGLKTGKVLFLLPGTPATIRRISAPCFHDSERNTIWSASTTTALTAATLYSPI